VIAGACHRFTIHGRDPAYDVTLGGDAVHFATAGEAVTIYDAKTRSYRPSTLLDLYDTARLVDRLDNIHRFCQTVIATEIEDPRVHAINIAYALVAGTQKSLAVSILGPDDIAAVIAMFDVIAGGEGEFRKKPFCTIGCCPILSPLRFGEEAVAAAIATLRQGVPCDFAVAPQAGATAPAALAGTLVQVTAETLATVILTNLFAPGHPTTYAAGEEALLGAAAVQVGNHYNLPTTVGAGMTDSKLPDGQAGYEKALTNALAGLAGANYVGECAGMQASLMGCSFEALVIDNDMLGAVERTIRGIEVTDETLSFEVMQDVAFGVGQLPGNRRPLGLRALGIERLARHPRRRRGASAGAALQPLPALHPTRKSASVSRSSSIRLTWRQAADAGRGGVRARSRGLQPALRSGAGSSPPSRRPWVVLKGVGGDNEGGRAAGYLLGVVGAEHNVAVQDGQSVDDDARRHQEVSHHGRGPARIVAAIARNIDDLTPAAIAVVLEDPGGELKGVGDAGAFAIEASWAGFDGAREALRRGPVVDVGPADRDLLLLADAPLDQGDGDAIVAGGLDSGDDGAIAEGQGQAVHLYGELVGIDRERGVDS
jgi:hypothetical protein